MRQNVQTMISSSDDNAYLLNFIQEYAHIGTWNFDLYSGKLHWSEQTKKIHEIPYDYAPVVEEAINFYKEGHSRNTIKELFKNCIEKFESFDVELEIITATGKSKWVRSIGMAIVENNVCIKAQGLFQDIDDKTKNALKLAAKEDQLRKSFEYSVIGKAIFALDGKILDVNKSICETFCYSKSEFLKLLFHEIVHPNDLKKFREEMTDMILGKSDYSKSEKKYYSKNGQIITGYTSTTIIRDNLNKPLYFITQIDDLTEIYNNREEILKLLRKSESQNKRLINFAHIVSHNLRSHYSNLDMLLNITKIDIPHITKNEIFPLIEQAVEHLGETVKNLNEVASINTNKKADIEPLNLLESFNKISASIAALLIESRSHVCVDIDKDIFVLGLPAYLDSILLNLLTNAIKYKKPNITPKIEVKALVKDKYVIVKVKDQGLGIDLYKHGHKLFGMYKTFHEHEEARGLGLFLTKNQVEALGGKIEVESQENVGTTFSVFLKKYE